MACECMANRLAITFALRSARRNDQCSLKSEEPVIVCEEASSGVHQLTDTVERIAFAAAMTARKLLSSVAGKHPFSRPPDERHGTDPSPPWLWGSCPGLARPQSKNRSPKQPESRHCTCCQPRAPLGHNVLTHSVHASSTSPQSRSATCHSLRCWHPIDTVGCRDRYGKGRILDLPHANNTDISRQVLSSEDTTHPAELYAAGQSLAQIGPTFSASHTTVTRCRRQAGHPAPRAQAWSVSLRTTNIDTELRPPRTQRNRDNVTYTGHPKDHKDPLLSALRISECVDSFLELTGV